MVQANSWPEEQAPFSPINKCSKIQLAIDVVCARNLFFGGGDGRHTQDITIEKPHVRVTSEGKATLLIRQSFDSRFVYSISCARRGAMKRR